jgi:GAF domain-containing protein
VQDVELMELATAQVGLAFENELLRRQLERMDRVVA